VQEEEPMSRRCAEPVDVRRGDGAPSEFVWRGRLYRVTAVLASWVEAGAWWRGPVARELFMAERADRPVADDLTLTAIPSSPAWGQRAWGEPAPDLGAVAVPAAGVDDGERELWRVEAAAGRLAPLGVFDLCFDWRTSRWTVAAVQD
jgi:hypothetical protein